MIASSEERLSVHSESYYCLHNYYRYDYDSHYKEEHPNLGKQRKEGMLGL